MDEAERLMFEGWASLPQFKIKIERSRQIIAEALALENSYVACSWGKDSTVLVSLLQSLSPDILVFHYASPESHAGIADNYPEVISKYLATNKTNYQELVAQKEWAKTKDTVQDRINSSLGDNYKIAFVGLRAEESKHRKLSLLKYTEIHQYASGKHASKYRACPLAWWTWRDVWAYIISNNLPYLNKYNYGEKSVSRTNPHARFWYSQDKDFVSADRELIRRYNPKLHNYLETENA